MKEKPCTFCGCTSKNKVYENNKAMIDHCLMEGNDYPGQCEI